MDLRRAMAQEPEQFWAVLQRQRCLLLLLVDNQMELLDWSQGFVDWLGWTEKENPAQLSDYLVPGEEKKLQELGEEGSTSLELGFVAVDGSRQELVCHVVPASEGFLVVGEKSTLSEGDALSQVTRLNNELSNMTRELSKKNVELEKANARVNQLLRTDPLTGIANRRFFLEMLHKSLAYARRHALPVAVAIADLDHFKEVNDTWGHSAGDEALTGFASTLAGNCREEDIVARIGGEEFALLLPATPLDTAVQVCERLRSQVESSHLAPGENVVTASFGVAENEASDTSESLLGRADRALYRAKAQGRNRVEAASESNALESPDS